MLFDFYSHSQDLFNGFSFKWHNAPKTTTNTSTTTTVTK